MSKDFDITGKINEKAKEFASKAKKRILIGLPDDRIHNPSGMTMAEVGAIHEFGSGDIPERSFLRGALASDKKEIKKMLALMAKGEITAEELALWGQGMVQKYMADGTSNFAPLKEARSDGSSNPLNDTGALRQGIIGIVKDD